MLGLRFHRVHHSGRLLRRRRIIEIGQRMPVYLAGENRELVADGLEVKGHYNL